MIRAGVWVLAAGLTAGCGPGGPALHSAAGKVVFRDGRPVTAGMVEFAPADGGPAARAKVGPDGRFTLTTGDRPGAVAGSHRVMVLSMAVSDGAVHGHRTKMTTVHPKYARFETSGLERTVEPDKSNEFTLTVDPAG